jgi:hypothetical protein
MVLCLAGRRPVLSKGGNARRQGMKTTFALLCPRSDPNASNRHVQWQEFFNQIELFEPNVEP